MSINVTVQPESINAGITQNPINVGIGNSVLWGAILGKPTGFQPIAHDHPQYYLNSNPSGFITFDQVTGATAGVASVNGLSGIINILGTGNNVITLNGNNILISGQNSSLVSIEGASVANPNFVGTGNVRLVTVGNDIYISGTGNFISRSETGVFATQILLQESGAYLDNKINDLSGQLGNYTLKSETGDFVSKTETGIFATSSRLIQTGASLDNKINTLSGFGAQSYALKSDTGNFISSTQTGGFANAFNLIQTGASLDNKINTLSGFTTNSFALKSDTGNFVSKTETGGYATAFNLFLTGQKIDQLSGYSNNSFALKADTGNFVSKTETGAYATAFNLYLTGQKIDILSGYTNTTFARKSDTGNFVSATQTGHLSRITVSGAYQSAWDLTGINGLQVIASGDRIVFSGGASQTGIVGDFVFKSETGQFVTQSDLLNTSGDLVALISASSAGVSALNGLSGVLNIVGTGGTQVFTSGQNIYISGGAGGPIDTGSLTGLFYPLTTNPSGYIRSISGDIYVPDSPQIYDGQLLVGSSGDNAFIQGGLYGSSGIVILTGSGVIGVSINQSTFILPSQTGVFATTQLVAATGQSLWASIVSLSGIATLDSETGILLNRSETGILLNRNETGVFATSQSLIESGQLFYPRYDNPSGYVRGHYVKGLTGIWVTGTTLTHTFSVVPNPDYTGEFFETGSFATLTVNDTVATQDYAYADYGAGIVNSVSVKAEIVGPAIDLICATPISETLSIISLTTGAGLDIVPFSVLVDGSVYGTNFFKNGVPVLTGLIAGTGISVTDNLDGSFIVNSTVSTGTFATATDLYNTGQLLYPRSNPSGFITGLNTGNFITTSQTGIFATVTQLNNSGQLLYPRSNPSGFVPSSGGNVSIQGGSTILDGQLLIGLSGDQSFTKGDLYGVSGIVILSGSGFLGVSIDQNLFALAANTGNFVSQTQTGILLNRSETGVFATAENLYNSGQLLYPRSNPSGFAPTSGGSILIEGGATILNGQLLIGNSGTNSFDQGNIWAGSGISIVSGSGYLIIHSTVTGGAGGGEINTASNLGAGSGWFAQKSTYDLQFKSLRVGAGLIVTGSATELFVDINTGVVVTGISAGSNVTVGANVNGVVQVSASAGGGLTWNSILGNSSLTGNNGYIVNKAGSMADLTLTSGTIGQTLRVTCISTGGYRLSQVDGLQTHFGNVSSTIGTGGYLQSTHYRDAIEMVAVSVSGWQVISSVGNFDIF